MARLVLEGTWEEIAAHADELMGKRLTVIVHSVVSEEAMDIPIVGPPNEGMLAALHEIESRQKDRRQTLGNSVETVRQGRTGPLYGMEPTHD
jgi:hypothetical protein